MKFTFTKEIHTYTSLSIEQTRKSREKTKMGAKKRRIYPELKKCATYSQQRKKTTTLSRKIIIIKQQIEFSKEISKKRQWNHEKKKITEIEIQTKVKYILAIFCLSLYRPLVSLARVFLRSSCWLGLTFQMLACRLESMSIDVLLRVLSCFDMCCAYWACKFPFLS